MLYAIKGSYLILSGPLAGRLALRLSLIHCVGTEECICRDPNYLANLAPTHIMVKEALTSPN